MGGRILAAAEEIFAEAGYSGATTAKIAERAGLPKANLHYYFRTKGALYRRLIERILEEWLASGEQIAPRPIRPRRSPPISPPRSSLAAAALRLQGVRQRDPARRAHGGDYLDDQVRAWVEAKARVIEGWVRRGLWPRSSRATSSS